MSRFNVFLLVTVTCLLSGCGFLGGDVTPEVSRRPTEAIQSKYPSTVIEPPRVVSTAIQKNTSAVSRTATAVSLPTDPITDSSTQIRIVRSNGEELTIDNPSYTSLSLVAAKYKIDNVDLSSILSIKNNSGSFKVVFSSGENIIINQLTGTLNYTNQLGSAKLDLSTIREYSLLKGAALRGNSTLPGYTYFHTELTFSDGSKLRVTQNYYKSGFIDNLSVSTKWNEYDVDVYPSLVPIEYDWTKGIIRAPLSDNPILSYPLNVKSTQKQVTFESGYLKFEWKDLVKTTPIGLTEEKKRFTHQIILKNGMKLVSRNITVPYCSSDKNCFIPTIEQIKLSSSGGFPDFDRLTVSNEQGEGSISYGDGVTLSIYAYRLDLDTEMGKIHLPFSSRYFSEIKKMDPAQMVHKNYLFHIKFTNGFELPGDFIQSVFSTTNLPPASSVLKLSIIPISIGQWLTEFKRFEAVKSGKDLMVRISDQQFPIVDTSANSGREFTIATDYGVFTAEMDEINKISPFELEKPVSSPGKRVSLVMDQGKSYSIICEKIQFVRYPDKIYTGTTYDTRLGAWYWRQKDVLEVKIADSVQQIAFEQVSFLQFTGSYPDWRVSIALKSGQTWSGNIVPGEVASKSPGIISWDASKEGFFCAMDSAKSFVFIPISRIREIKVE